MQRSVVILLVLALVVSACGSDSDSGATTSTTGSTTPSTTATTTTLAPASSTTSDVSADPGYSVFDGDDFYEPPAELPPNNGDLIWAETLSTPGATRGWKVLYRSEAIDGTPIAVSGYVMAPRADPPEGGFPIISWAHGTTGLGDLCAPSADPNLGEFLGLVAPFLGTQYVFAATDYEGLGTPGVHPYIVGESQGRGVVDIVRATLQIPATNAGSRYAVWGHSQGGHAALWAGEIAPTWAPELDLVGVAAGAPPSQFGELNQSLLDSEFRGYLAMLIEAYSATYPEATVESVLTQDAVLLLDVMETGCLSDIQAAYEGIDPLLSVTGLDGLEPWESLAEANEPGQRLIEAPVIILHGQDDEQIPVESSAVLLEEMCAAGSTVERRVYPGQSHAGVVLAYAIDLVGWLSNRFADLPATNDCVT